MCVLIAFRRSPALLLAQWPRRAPRRRRVLHSNRLRPLVLGSPASRNVRRPCQLFFLVCATKPENCATTFVPLHVGHFGLAFSRSEMVMISSNGFLHFSQRYS